MTPHPVRKEIAKHGSNAITGGLKVIVERSVSFQK